MSEINSIANGSFVLGQTSATNFVGGTGITVDSPSEGTVRISNDETVLWSGTAFNPAGSNNPMSGTAYMSESIFNFDQIRLDFIGSVFNESVLLTNPINTEEDNYFNVKKEQKNNNLYIGTKYRFNNETTLTGFCSYGTTQNIGTMTGGYWHFGGVVRVVGINRISGGNA
jgi:hypothetical protein